MRICTRLKLHIVEGLCKLALLTGSGVLVDDSTSSSLVDLLYSSLVGGLSELSVAFSNSSLILLDIGLELGLEDLVLHGLRLGNDNTLLRTLDIRH